MAGTTASSSGLVRLVRGLLVRPHHDVRAALLFWGPLAVACLVAGFMVADNPSRSDAYFEVRNWLAMWRLGINVYEVPGLLVDYPPHALVFLSPMMLFPAASGELVFAGFNVLICIATSWTIVSLTAGYAGVSLSRVERLAYVLMLLVWSPTRVGIWNGQTSPLLILCCCLALRLSAWSSIVAGVLMAVGMSKPHLALGFALLATFFRMWKMLAVAAFTTIAAALVYVATVHKGPIEVLQQYIGNLFSVYGGPSFLRAEVDIRPFFTDLIGNYAIAEPLYLLTASILGTMLLYFAWRGRHNIDAGVWVMSSGLMWSIAIFPFRRYGMLLLAPTVLMLLWRPRVSKHTLTWAGAIIFLIAADLPFVIRHIGMQFGPPSGASYGPYLHYINRMVTVTCLIASFVTLARLSRPGLIQRTPKLS